MLRVGQIQRYSPDSRLRYAGVSEPLSVRCKGVRYTPRLDQAPRLARAVRAYPVNAGPFQLRGCQQEDEVFPIRGPGDGNRSQPLPEAELRHAILGPIVNRKVDARAVDGKHRDSRAIRGNTRKEVRIARRSGKGLGVPI